MLRNSIVGLLYNMQKFLQLIKHIFDMLIEMLQNDCIILEILHIIPIFIFHTMNLM